VFDLYLHWQTDLILREITICLSNNQRRNNIQGYFDKSGFVAYKADSISRQLFGDERAALLLLEEFGMPESIFDPFLTGYIQNDII